MNQFKIGDTVWFFNGENCQKETVVEYDKILNMYELSDGNFYDKTELYKTKGECLKAH